MPPDELGFIPEASAAPLPKTPDDGLGFVPHENSKESDLGFVPEEKDKSVYEGGAQQAVAGLEGLAKGVAGPLATLAETKLLGIKSEDIEGRAEANPWTHGIAEGTGLIGGALIPGVGEYTIGAKIGQIGKAAEVAAKAAEIGKVGQTAIKLGLEGGIFHIADNASKMILGQTDPEAPVASLLAGTPAAVLLGGGLGAAGGKAATKLQDMANSRAAGVASNFLSDLGNSFEFFTKNKDVPMAATEEAQHLYDTVSSAAQSGFSLKRESIEKLTKELAPATTSAYVNGMLHTLENTPGELQGSPGFRRALGEWKARTSIEKDIIGAHANVPSAADIFEATDDFKREVGKLAKFDSPQFGHQDQEMGKAAGNLYHNLRKSLENPGAWGEMGNFQKELNSAYSKMLTPLKAFESSAMSKNEQLVKQVDQAKIASIFRSVEKGKPLTGFRDAKVSGFFDPARKFLETVDKLHMDQGLESNIPKVPTTVLDKMLNKEISHGAKVGEWLFGAGPGAIGWAGSHAVGTAVGTAVGHPYLGFRAGEHLFPMIREMGLKPTRAAVSATLRALSAGEPGAIPEAIHYADGIRNGAARIEASIDNLFKVGGKQYMESDHSSDHREKLKKFVEDGTLSDQLANMAAPALPQKGSEEQKFAEGGPVLAPAPALASKKPVGRAIPKNDRMSTVFPEQSMLLGAAKSRINGYLNQIRPQAVSAKLPFDEHVADKGKERDYNKALDIANKPLSVIDHIKNGTLDPDHVKHMNALYPELSNHLQKKISEQIIKAQLKNEKPPYKVRQAMSLFMGAPMDSNLTQANIMAAQASFMKAAPPGQGAPKGSSTKGLSDVSQQFQTHDQAIQSRQRRPK